MKTENIAPTRPGNAGALPAAAKSDGIQKRAPTLYLIIAFKLLKGSLFVTLAIVAYCLSDNNLPSDYQNLLQLLRIQPGNRFFQDLAIQIGKLTEARVLWAAAGTLVYSLFSLVEGTGMIFRAGWAGWLAIGESSFFIPLEVYELVHSFNWYVLIVLIINIGIVWYLYQNRDKLFHHHHFHHRENTDFSG